MVNAVLVHTVKINSDFQTNASLLGLRDFYRRITLQLVLVPKRMAPSYNCKK